MQTERIREETARFWLCEHPLYTMNTAQADRVLRWGHVLAVSKQKKSPPLGIWLELPLSAPVSLCDRVRPLLFGKAETLCCPFAGEKTAEEAVLRQMLQETEVEALLLPLQFAGWPQMIFEKGYQLLALRPAAAWKPFGIFALSPQEKNGYNKKEVLSLSNLHALSQSLEWGARGLARTQHGILIGERQRKTTEKGCSNHETGHTE